MEVVAPRSRSALHFKVNACNVGKYFMPHLFIGKWTAMSKNSLQTIILFCPMPQISFTSYLKLENNFLLSTKIPWVRFCPSDLHPKCTLFCKLKLPKNTQRMLNQKQVQQIHTITMLIAPVLLLSRSNGTFTLVISWTISIACTIAIFIEMKIRNFWLDLCDCDSYSFHRKNRNSNCSTIRRCKWTLK